MVIVYLAVINNPAVPVVGVLAEADVGDDKQIWVSILESANGVLGDTVGVTADVRNGGSVRVSILDGAGNIQAASDPITDTVTDGRVKWRKSQDVVGLRGERIRLRFQLRNAKLYSFQIRRE